MSLETFRLLVLSDSTVGTHVGSRMTQNMLPPEAQTPAITFFVVAEKPDVDTCDDLYVMERIQTNVYAEDISVRDEIHGAMRALLHMYSGTYNNEEIVSITMDFGMTTFETETKLYRRIADWKMKTKAV